MTITIAELSRAIDPKRTVLLFGSGSSIPSGAPSVPKIIETISRDFSIPANGYNLREISSLAEAKPGGRPKLIGALRALCGNLQPTGGLRNLPLYEWKSIFTTNYDTLIEQSYELRHKRADAISSNFDFRADKEPANIEVFKIHGTIDKDVVDGNNSRIIITDGDYDQTGQFREFLFDRLKGDLVGADVVIIGHSLADEDVRSIIDRAAAINATLPNASRIYLLLYTADENRASLFERRGMVCAFGGIDEFFAALAPRATLETKSKDVSDPLDVAPMLRPTTTEARHAVALMPDVSAMFNGWPATYASIQAGHTFKRRVADQTAEHFAKEATLTATLLGASGVGKTTAARQAAIRLQMEGYWAWEHNPDHSISVEGWSLVADYLKAKGEVGVLIIDDAHQHLYKLNDLVDHLVAIDNAHLKLLMVATRSQWYPRIKSPNLSRYGTELRLSTILPEEIERLIDLVDRSEPVKALVEDQFSGFNRPEKRRRLVDRCQSDMFVCLKNIFANDSIDQILLREFASVSEPYQDVYRYVAALETAGIRVHRQLVVRLLGIPADHIEAALKALTDIVTEYAIEERYGVYGWRCRHPVISAIITKFKFQDIDKIVELFDRTIDAISPTYEVELRSLRELCSIETGIPRIPNRDTQNRLFRKIISNVPGERVPRHKLIRNLIDQGHFEKAETEIRLFNKDFGSDGPVHRYRVRLMVARAVRTPGILTEDRIAYLNQAYELALAGLNRYQHHKLILSALGEVGVEYYRITGDYAYFDEAIGRLKEAEEYLGDPEIGLTITRLERRLAGQPAETGEVTEEA